MRQLARALVALVLLAPALSGCETTMEKSARLQRVAKARERTLAAKAHGLSIGRPSRVVKVLATAVVHSSEGAAVAVTLRNPSARALAGVPIEIHVRDARGTELYANTAPGLGTPLTSLALLPAHGQATWVDDQIQLAGSGAPVRVGAIVGEGQAVSGANPRLEIAGAHPVAEPGGGAGAEGKLVNGSAVSQRELVITGVAVKGGRIVGAGRAVLAQAPAHASTPFQLFFIGQAAGARLRFGVEPTTLR